MDAAPAAAGHWICHLMLRHPLLKISKIIRSALQRSRQRCAATLSWEVSRTAHGGINVSVIFYAARMNPIVFNSHLYIFITYRSCCMLYLFSNQHHSSYQVTMHMASMNSNSTTPPYHSWKDQVRSSTPRLISLAHA